MQDYDHICLLANKLGYKRFTALQQKTFDDKTVYDFHKWMFVIGATSSGKTLIALLCYFREYLLHKEIGQPFRMLFAVPYRSLAAQKKTEISEMVNKLNLDLNIVQSTGEFRSDDTEVIKGKVDIAVIIYEKVFMFASMYTDFLKGYNMLVMDEIGLTQDLSRGIKADLILVRARMIPSLRVFALATPFYDWSVYIEAYHFFAVREDVRPTKVETYPIYYTKDGVNYVQESCRAVKVGLFAPLNNGAFDLNPRHRLDYVIEDICQYHLKQGHKILIFENSREEVKLLSRRLYKSLAKCGILSPWTTDNECRRYVRQVTNINSDDELYGIMEEDDYKAFALGISYHNADVPTTLRILVEKEFLQNEGRLRLLCSTETLVYGINSNADVVIIPCMVKQRHDEDGNMSFLYANEYMNYAGRAGRLNSTDFVEGQNRVGYIYPILKAVYDEPDEFRCKSATDQKLLWDSLQKEINKPQIIGSRYFVAGTEQWPFYVLSLFPSGDGVRSANTITEGGLKILLEKIPRASGVRFDDNVHVLEPIKELIDRKLIYVANDCEDEDEDFIPEYCLTDTGKSLTGYIIRLSDFDALIKVACECINKTKIYTVDLLNKMITDREISQNIRYNIIQLSATFPASLDRAVMAMEKLLEWREGQTSKALYKKLKANMQRFNNWTDKGNYTYLAKDRNFISQRILCILLIWSDEQCTVKQLYEAFSVNYMQAKRLAELISYRLDIIRCALPIAHIGLEQSLYQQLGPERIREAGEELGDLSNEMLYRIPVHICRFLNVQCYDPHTALNLREIATIYTYLNKLLIKEGKTNRKEKKRINSIVKKIREWKPEWQELFYNRFGRILNDGD